ncbi:hypothetical protein [Cellulophaga baltica]|uniref:hypothetical protein n=1 Tax=Cellulophaga baltica TaxID=76594 RepID=UPI00040A5D61|nr:hypothetical protein [Cellulophaga baltica]
MEVEDYKRKITHTDYGKGETGLQQYAHLVDKVITKKPRPFTLDDLAGKKVLLQANLDYLIFNFPAKVAPHMGGGVALIVILIFLVHSSEEWTFIYFLFFSISCIAFVFFTIYFFTMPKKEKILNRKDGLITFTGFYWQPNVTMAFTNAIFSYSTGGEDATGSFMLQVIRPTKGYTFELFGAGGGDCYDDISFITWYMDKNRPLPPGDAFDEYRLQDFERRKAEGFPRPLYPSNIPTPEATIEQQKEREKIGGW